MSRPSKQFPQSPLSRSLDLSALDSSSSPRAASNAASPVALFSAGVSAVARSRADPGDSPSPLQSRHLAEDSRFLSRFDSEDEPLSARILFPVSRLESASSQAPSLGTVQANCV